MKPKGEPTPEELENEAFNQQNFVVVNEVMHEIKKMAYWIQQKNSNSEHAE